MKQNAPRLMSGFVLLEVLIVLALIAALTSIAIPRYQAYNEKARGTVCLANRYQIEMDARADYLETDTVNLQIDSSRHCPSGGVYVWLVSDPADPRFPEVGCSVHQAAASPLPSENTMFSSDFETMEGLSELIGEWDIDSNNLTSTGPGENRISFGETDWTDVAIQLNAEIADGKGYGIYYRADGEKDITGYCFQYDPGYGSGAFLVRKVVSGREQSPFQRVSIPEEFPVFNQSHTITIEVKDNRHIINVDGEEIFSFQDDTFAQGSAGLRTWGGSDVNFHDVTVEAL